MVWWGHGGSEGQRVRVRERERERDSENTKDSMGGGQAELGGGSCDLHEGREGRAWGAWMD